MMGVRIDFAGAETAHMNCVVYNRPDISWNCPVVARCIRLFRCPCLSEHIMASLQRKEEALKTIIRNSPIRYICPQCFRLFPREDLLNRHIREQSDDTHAALAKGKSAEQSDMEEFLTSYRLSVNTSVAAENIPPSPDCFAVDFVVKYYHSFSDTTATLERRVDTLKEIIQASTIGFVCPICLRGFPRPALLYDHFRKRGDDAHALLGERSAEEQWETRMHAGLAKRTSRKQRDIEEFLTCYRQSVRTSMAVEDIPLNSCCFDVNFVVEHYRENIGTQH
ncbi:hypothetical protein V6Z93_010531 [Aspergillus fumigatus]